MPSSVLTKRSSLNWTENLPLAGTEKCVVGRTRSGNG